ncbi:hypothetical protein TSTA_022940 [Talaromyces stipitatus ATCC 10500]|uniref:Integrase catalytic domain-containing protein n=1 Tax=Talaromyces stipitatus (strain ATCC 10500 / CBS 375.48 / QM 6759 / NRRL 1006) TaxID=441959 RepID=B8MEV7_TALSN|nr:uncharacterized protein TSTA_022940 [Talaromyces stipitatus ATCC 10500]EED17240.1 hypothetical protein TSTA_022940 [Talaromyces stipitatus ATCC 10500]
MDSPTPFLFCLKDMNRLRVKFNNLTNEMIQGDLIVPVIRKRGHPWFFLDEKYAPEAFLTEVEMRWLYRWFGHPAVDRLHKVLKRAGYLNVDYKMLAQIEEFCHHCQMNRQALKRFKFTLHDDCEYNYEIVVDVMYLDGKPVPVKAHNAISKVERYHTLLRHAYNIILSELSASVDKEIILQMAVKAINNTVGLDRLVPTVLVFDAYPRITYDLPPSALTAKRAQAIRKAMIDLRNAMATHKVNDALKARNSPIVMETLNLAPGTDVQVWREGKGWTGPHKVISVNDYNVIMDLPSGVTDFRATSVRRYQRDEIESSPTRRLLGTDLPPQKEEEGRKIDSLLTGQKSGLAFAQGSSSCDAAASALQEVELGEPTGAGYNDAGKTGILTQAPTIQRASQRLVVLLIATLILMGMAYTQSKSKLQRLIVANLPAEMRDKYPLDSLLLVEGALYGIPEAGVHWFDTYQSHYKDRLGMETSTYDPCLLMTTKGKENFGLVGIQTDDTLLVSTESFAGEEQVALQEAGFKAKPKTRLSQQVPIEFNGARITLQDEKVYFRQKGQAAKIKPVGKEDRAQKYVEQRARGAYLASICQPEAAYDLAVAAQLQEKDRSEADYDALNKRLIWQAENPDRGLCFVPIDLTKAKIMIFTDGSFANNRDLTSQIGFLIAMCTGLENLWPHYWLDQVYPDSTVNMITKRLGQPEMPVVVCTDSYSLYECLTKLGTTKEKRLMIDLMALRQSYERHEIDEIRWIHGDDNPADAFTKSNPNKALRDFVGSNKVTIQVEGFIKRTRID